MRVFLALVCVLALAMVAMNPMTHQFETFLRQNLGNEYERVTTSRTSRGPFLEEAKVRAGFYQGVVREDYFFASKYTVLLKRKDAFGWGNPEMVEKRYLGILGQFVSVKKLNFKYVKAQAGL